MRNLDHRDSVASLSLQTNTVHVSALNITVLFSVATVPLEHENLHGLSALTRSKTHTVEASWLKCKILISFIAPLRYEMSALAHHFVFIF